MAIFHFFSFLHKFKDSIDYIKLKLNSINRLSKNLFTSIIIKVDNDDGMSWSAESINILLRKDNRTANFKYYCFANEPEFNGRPKIINFLGLKNFCKIAKKYNLTKSYNNIFSLNYTITLSFLLLIGTIYNILKSHFTHNQFFNFDFFIISFVLVSLSIVFQFLIKNISEKTIPKCLDEYIESTENNKGTVNFQKFIDALAKELSYLEFPRFIIIDNYEGLDYSTKRVIERYFKKFSENSTGTEIWIIFEAIDGESFSHKVLLNRNSYGYSNSEIFIQENLTEKERQELAKIVGHPERSEFKKVKKICKGFYGSKTEEYFLSYRDSHPKDIDKYGDLEFLFLLSLNSLPTINYVLTDDIIIHEFSRKKDSSGSKLRDNIIREFLYGTRNTQEEIANKLKNIHDKFSSFISVRNRTFVISKDATEVLINLSPNLNLPSYKLGHLYWAHFWYDKLEKHKIEPYWIKKLTFHLLESDINKIKNDKTFNKIISAHYNAFIFAISSSIKSGIFQYLDQLIVKAFFLLQNENLKNNSSFYKNLYRECWKAYAITGNDKIMEIIVQISTHLVNNRTSTNKKFPLENLFFETIVLPQSVRDILNPDFSSYRYGNKELIKSVSDFAKIKAIWLSLSLDPFIYILNENSISYASFKQSMDELDSMFYKIFNRIIENPTSFKIIDVITLSLTMWLDSYLLNKKYELYELKEYSKNIFKNFLNNRDNMQEIFENLSIGLKELFEDSVKKAKDIILLASELKKEGDGELDISTGINFPLGALSRELCVIALSSVFISAKYLFYSLNNYSEILRKYDDLIVSLLNGLLEDISFVLEIDLIKLNKLEDIFKKKNLNFIENLLSPVLLIWREFNIKNLEQFLLIRKIIFKSNFLHKDEDNLANYHHFIELFGEILSENSYTGILANISLANILINYGEFKSHYLSQASIISLNNDFGINFKNDLSLIAIYNGYRYNLDIIPFIRHIVNGEKITDTFLYKYLHHSKSDKKVLPIIWELLNKIYYSEKEINNRVINIITKLLQDHIFEESMEDEIHYFFKYLELQNNIKLKKHIAWESVHNEWQNKKEFWLYPSVISLLIENRFIASNIIDEVILALDRDPKYDTSNTYFFLALTFLKIYISEKSIPVKKISNPINYIKRFLESDLVDLLTLETQIEAYIILINLDGNDTNYFYYREKIQNLQEIKLERDHLKELPKLISQNRFFSILFNYINTFQYWGLKFDINQDEFYSKINISIEKKKKYLEQIKIETISIPEPIKYSDSAIQINSEFFILGKYLLDITNGDSTLYGLVLQKFNEKSKQNLTKVLDIIRALPKLPKSIKELLDIYKKKFDKYTMPQLYEN